MQKWGSDKVYLKMYVGFGDQDPFGGSSENYFSMVLWVGAILKVTEDWWGEEVANVFYFWEVYMRKEEKIRQFRNSGLEEIFFIFMPKHKGLTRFIDWKKFSKREMG